MAKRRKEKDEEEDKPFKMPKFDEEAFLKRERRNVKTTVVSFFFGILLALVCFGFWAAMGKHEFRWPLVLLVGVINAAFLKYIYERLNFDLTDFARKNWFGSYAIYFFTWLIVFIVLVNPPFYDDEAPFIEVAVLLGMQELGGTVEIVAKITDNGGVDTDSITLEIIDPNENTTSLIPTYEDLVASFTYENSEDMLGEFSYTLTAKDTKGQMTIKTGSFNYDVEVIEVTSSRFENITSGDDIEIEVEEGVSIENFRVYYTLDDGDEINVNRKYVEVKAEYEASPEFKGWNENNNYTMKLFVEVSHYFVNVIDKKYSNTIEGSTTYDFTTGNDNDIGDETAPMPWNWSKASDEQAPVLLNYDHLKIGENALELNKQVLLPYPQVVAAPGFETIIFLVSLIAVVILFKYKKKNRSNQK